MQISVVLEQFGGSVSGTVTMNKNNGGFAYLESTEYALNAHYFTVLPGTSTSFGHPISRKEEGAFI
ncbi:hypothetical protein [Bacillus mesophilum]|uniref:Uncharacterized protein n=1 Tax=Bacillus mesophilum TaxID=1071718 RepID=A0A7V7RI54_9BACI|nr:hypothetical protein [Bacillus mesophilum]KAB2329481.1 hypothetical protein F7732_21385 [Bacillus mesophilum]